MAATTAELVSEAKARIEQLTPDEVERELAIGDVVLVDLREPGERDQQGTISGALHAPRGMLEFYADSASPYHLGELDPTARTILYCASGGRSALGCVTLTELGYTDVAHLEGGFKAWVEAEKPVERA
jgi:rhodanese-related sulfurtransferase